MVKVKEEKYSLKVTPCDFCPSKDGRLMTAILRNCYAEVSACKSCKANFEKIALKRFGSPLLHLGIEASSSADQPEKIEPEPEVKVELEPKSKKAKPKKVEPRKTKEKTKPKPEAKNVSKQTKDPRKPKPKANKRESGKRGTNGRKLRKD